jgi:hypothetical protein
MFRLLVAARGLLGRPSLRLAKFLPFQITRPDTGKPVWGPFASFHWLQLNIANRVEWLPHRALQIIPYLCYYNHPGTNSLRSLFCSVALSLRAVRATAHQSLSSTGIIR